MFGRGRMQNGVLIDVRPDFAFDPENEADLSSFRQRVWFVVFVWISYGNNYELAWISRPTVERMNEFAPAHSKVFKEVSMSVPTCLEASLIAHNTSRWLLYPTLRNHSSLIPKEDPDATFCSIDTHQRLKRYMRLSKDHLKRTFLCLRTGPEAPSNVSWRM